MAQRLHKATYATDKKNGGYLIRVAGPTPEKFSGRVVPVTMKNGDEHEETLERMIWKGADQETGLPVALYKFKARPREKEEETAF
jgi:hypothetical protein